MDALVGETTTNNVEEADEGVSAILTVLHAIKPEARTSRK
jgi:hypothetical protein